MLTIVAVLAFVVAPAPADDSSAERDLLRRALAQIAERPMSDELVPVLEEIHARAWRLGDAETAHAAIDEIVVWWDETQDSQSPALAKKLSNLSVELKDLGDFGAALPLQERALEIFERTFGPDDQNVGKCLVNLGGVYLLEGRHEDARRAFAGALRIFESAYGPDDPYVARVLAGLAMLDQLAGDYSAARSGWERALAIYEEAPGRSEPVVVARTMNDLALALEKQGDFAAARDLHERALALREQSLGPEHPLVSESLANLAGLLRSVGDYDESQRLYERALAVTETAFGPLDSRVGRILNNLGVLNEDRGRLVEARRYYERALAVHESGSDAARAAGSLENLAGVMLRLGDAAEALRMTERVLAIMEHVHGPDHLEFGETLANRANLLRATGDLEAARATYARALALTESALGAESLRVAEILNNAAGLSRELGDAASARSVFERSLAIREAALGPEHPDVAMSLHGLATALRDLGELDAAGAALDRSLLILESTFGRGHIEAARVLTTMVKLSLDSGDHERAFELAQRLSDQSHSVWHTVRSLAEGESHRYVATRWAQRAIFLSAAKAVGQPEAGYTAVLDGKGRLARLALQTKEQIRSTRDPETLRLADELARKDAQLSRLVRETDVVDFDARSEVIRSLRLDRDALERELRRRADLTRKDLPTPAAVVAALPPGSAAVDLFIHPVYEPADRGPGSSHTEGRWSEPRVSAWVVRSGESEVHHVDLGLVAPIEAALARHLQMLDPQSTDPRGVSPRRSDPGPSGESLHALLWQPVEKLVEGASTIFVSPDGSLGALPFETLEGEDGRFLIQRHHFVYLASTGDIVHRDEQRKGSTGLDMLAVGNVDYDAKEVSSAAVAEGTGGQSHGAPLGRARESGPIWPRLSKTTIEIEEVTQLHSQVPGVTPALVLTGQDASEGRLRRELPGREVVHLATHGFFRSHGEIAWVEVSHEAIRDDRSLLASEEFRRAHPGVSSGLVLAGANASADGLSGLDDGYLTASEIAQLDLSSADLVVLSACQTGLGHPQSGEGLLSVRRACHTAGAATVVSSLWSVSDERTRELMRSFYENVWKKGMARGEALRVAQLSMMERNREQYGSSRPSTWGAFVLSGEWRELRHESSAGDGS